VHESAISPPNVGTFHDLYDRILNELRSHCSMVPARVRHDLHRLMLAIPPSGSPEHS